MKKKIDVKKHILAPATIDVGVEQSSGAKLSFNFNKQWNGLLRKISFETQLGVVVLEIGDDSCVDVPAEIMLKAGVYEYILTGTRGSQTLITIPGFVKVLPAGNVISSSLSPGFSLQELLERIERVEVAALEAQAMIRAVDELAFMAYVTAVNTTEVAHMALSIAENADSRARMAYEIARRVEGMI